MVEWKPPRRENWVIGDIVRFCKGKPSGIEARRNELSRFGFGGVIQVLAANLDLLLITTACGEAFKPGLIDRFLVAAGHASMEPVIILNKIDLPGADRFVEEMRKYETLGYKIIFASAKTGEGIAKLENLLRDSVSALVGHSGVGKTSIINMLAPGLNRNIAEIHEKTARGRHTTSSALMVSLPNGGDLIDSPGIRQFIPSGLEPEDVAAHFPGVKEWMGHCKFRNCRHLSEPACSVRQALKDHKLDIGLYESYVRIVKSIEDNTTPSY